MLIVHGLRGPLALQAKASARTLVLALRKPVRVQRVVVAVGAGLYSLRSDLAGPVSLAVNTLLVLQISNAPR